DIVDAVLEEAGKFAAEVLAPLNASGDREGCTRHQDGTVSTPEGFREAHQKFRESGWGTLAAPEQFGGQGMPEVLGFAVEEFMSSANMAFSMYPGLTNGAVSALLVKGSPELQEKYVPKMVANEWLGTMNLTEPQCGTDLGLITTKAEPQADGSYAVTGTKIFISAGEHDLTENIIHLVLARTPDAPEGTKGISLFVVPKFLVNEDGSLGERNGASCGALEHKMGIHANATCVMNYDRATGWMVGDENKGLAAMFIMMNAARLGVGIQGLSQAEVAFQNGLAYALERRQGRALSGPAEPDEKADPLFVHPDIRRLLMDAKALTEGMRALALWGGLLVGLAEKATSEEERERADDLVGLLTPVIKGYGTDKGYEVATVMQQIWGGHGYIAENGMEQFVRDARIAMIYEGANGVQAMDLVGRKLARNGGRAIQALFALVDEECAAAKDDEQLADLATRVEKTNGELKAATMWFMQNAMAKPDNAGAGAYHYMDMVGIVALGLMWLRMAKTAAGKLAEGAGDQGFYEAKLTTARYFGERFTPDAGALRRKIETGAETMMELPAAAFERV
ncbi:MAG: acyl-CoA dehydrogenase C-terminal domain-containing protein, partial [Novosphingobium sp.]|nr:acyl-CoA dehydrogenase C-terminal domain-containing protein [Novosphingobium sp.]